ncbi:MAG: hypothetical protein ACKVP2_04120 [Burkholderiales bacterium]
MSTHDQTLKIVTNLDRAGIEQQIGKIRDAAQAADLSELVQLLSGIEGKPRAQFEQKLQEALKWLRGKSAHAGLAAQLEMLEMNLPNLK